MSKATAVTSADFDSVVLQSEVPVLVDFWAAWCGPCRRVAPELEAAAEQLGDKVKIVKVDVDAEPELSSRFGIQGIPALFIFKGGKVVQQMVGIQSRAVIAEKLQQHI